MKGKKININNSFERCKIKHAKFYRKLGQYLKEQREECQITQSEISATLGLASPQFVSNIERGKCNVPYYILRKMIKEYSLDRDEFIEIYMSLWREELISSLKR